MPLRLSCSSAVRLMKIDVEGLLALDFSSRTSRDFSNDEAVPRSTEALHTGVDVIIQPALRDDHWFGRPDVLRRCETPSALGPWSYQVVDTKLARETRGGTILQLVLYSELLTIVQGSNSRVLSCRDP